MADNILQKLSEFADILKLNEPLAPYTFLKIGGPAEALAQPRTREELAALVKACFAQRIPLRILGGGCNILIRDEGVGGVVLRLNEPAFTQIEVKETQLRAGSGASLAAAISEAARHGLAGLETLVGIPGTVGGAICHNAGDRVAEIGQFVRQIDVADTEGRIYSRERDELALGNLTTGTMESVILSVDLQLEKDSADVIVKRMRKAWIQQKAKQPLSFQAAVRAFRNPRGLSAAAMIEQAGLAGTKVGGAQVSERDPNYIIVNTGAGTRDILRLIDLMRSRVEQHFQVELEREPTVW